MKLIKVVFVIAFVLFEGLLFSASAITVSSSSSAIVKGGGQATASSKRTTEGSTNVKVTVINGKQKATLNGKPIAPARVEPKKVGPCKAAMQRWYFNVDTEKCEQFIFGGCQANRNNFKSKFECEQLCAEVKPCICTADFSPVCCEGEEFSNLCVAKCELTPLKALTCKKGPCPKPSTPTPTPTPSSPPPPILVSTPPTKCEDIRPPKNADGSQATCKQMVNQGFCNQDWLKNGKYCEKSCGVC